MTTRAMKEPTGQSTHSAVEMLHDSALYKYMIDIDIDFPGVTAKVERGWADSHRMVEQDVTVATTHA